MTQKVKCSKCKKLKFVNPKALEVRIKKFGSIEEIEKKWICRECLKGQKKEVKEKEVIKNKEEEIEPKYEKLYSK